MKIGLNLFWVWLLGAVLLPAVVQAQLSFTTNGGAITITGYNTAAGLDVIIPAATNGYPVTTIGDGAFISCPITNVTIGTNVTTIGDGAFVASGLTKVTIPNSVTSIGPYAFCCSNLTSVSIPNSVTNIGVEAFYDCFALTNAYFLGDVPPDYGTAFTGDLNGDLINDPATVYYLSGTSGWGLTFGGVPAVLWNPQAKTGDGSFGVQSNKFGFSITGSSNLVIVVEAATNLASPIWSPVSTNTLNTFVGTNGTSYFSDPQWTNYPGRFYRLRSP